MSSLLFMNTSIFVQGFWCFSKILSNCCLYAVQLVSAYPIYVPCIPIVLYSLHLWKPFLFNTHRNKTILKLIYGAGEWHSITWRRKRTGDFNYKDNSTTWGTEKDRRDPSASCDVTKHCGLSDSLQETSGPKSKPGIWAGHKPI